MLNSIIETFSNSYFQKILLGIFVLGFATGSIGLFSTLRKQALIGDALSHAALPGVVLAFIIFGTRDLEVLLLGAVVSAFLAMGLINLFNNYSKTKFDASMALILSSFFAFGNVLMLILGGGHGLDKFIFGEAATMLQKEVNLIMIASFIALILVIIFFRHIKLYIFDKAFYKTLGYKGRFINTLLTVLTVLVVVISIRTIGVVLMSALLITPAITARLLSNKLNITFILSGLFGSLGGLLGTVISFNYTNLPTGPVIIVVLSSVLILFLLFAPKNGIISKSVKISRHKKLIVRFHGLVHIYEYSDVKNITDVEIDFFIENNYLNKINNEYELTNKGVNIVHNILKGENLWV